jgi:CRISPR system Cascade subunit CasE
MYLSKLTLDPMHPQARRDLGSPYEMHRTLARVYAPDAHTQPQPFLWRLEPGRDPAHSATILVQGNVVGNWSVLDQMPGYAVEVLSDKPVDLERLIRKAGDRFRFRILANPTVTREGKRHGLTREDEQLGWLRRQGGKRGFSLDSCLRLGNERIQTRQGPIGRRITLQTVLFEGVLEASDVAHLRVGVRFGLGHGKAMGLGLLSLARVA